MNIALRKWIRLRHLTACFASLFLLACLMLIFYTGPSPIIVQANFLRGAHVDTAVRTILERSCRDCHSDDTRFPWYSLVPFVSAVIREDVARGREQLNFSRWSEYSRLRKQRALTGIANQVVDRAMPLREYLALHPSAKLSDRDIDIVFKWAQAERLRLIMEGDANTDVVQ